MDQLTLRYEYDASHTDVTLPRDDFGRLYVAVETDRFSGRGSCWVQWQEVVEFGQSMSVYPIPYETPLIAQWGHEKVEGDGLTVRIEIGQKNSLGELVALVELADQNGGARASFRTGYPALQMFQRDISKLMAGESEIAILLGH